MNFPITDRAIDETIKREALTLPAPKDMARRAGIRLTPRPAGGQNIAASFTLVNDDLGYVEDHGDALVFFLLTCPEWIGCSTGGALRKPCYLSLSLRRGQRELLSA